MSLIKARTTPYKINATYWKITTTNIDWINYSAVVGLGGFLDKTRKEAGAKPIDGVSFNWTNEEFPLSAIDTGAVTDLTVDDIRRAIYLKIRESKLDENGLETNFWADAIDDL